MLKKRLIIRFDIVVQFVSCLVPIHRDISVTNFFFFLVEMRKKCASNLQMIEKRFRNENFELSSSFVEKWKIDLSLIDDVDPFVFRSYLLYLQSGYFLRPKHLSTEDLIENLNRCLAPKSLVDFYQNEKILLKRKFSKKSVIEMFIFFSFLVCLCLFSIDLYRQMFNSNGKTKILIIFIYLSEGIFFFSNFYEGIRRFISMIDRRQFDVDFFINFISSFSSICFFIDVTFQRLCRWNFLWIFVNLCRTIRFVQFSFHFDEIRFHFESIFRSVSIFLRTFLGIFLFFIVFGSILLIVDLIEGNEQFFDVRSTIFSAHETLFAIGYRNNAPFGRSTRLWTIFSIYFFSSVVQMFIWNFQNELKRFD